MIIKSIILTDKNELIDLREFANGLYLVRMQVGGKLDTVRYIKN
jgi:hypothetical protein